MIHMHMYDTHVHSKFSCDGVSSLNDYACLLEEGKVLEIGFSEHVDFIPECGSFGYFDYEAYVSSISEFKSRGYAFYAGAEIDYAVSVEDEIIRHLRQKSYDYLICSVHMINGVSISERKNAELYRDRHAFADMIQKYYNEMSSSLNVKEFDVIGHVNIYRRHMTGDFFRNESLLKMMNELDSDLAKLCAQSGKILEVNTSGLFSPYGSIIPDINFLKQYYKYGGRLISVGSDAHSAQCVARGFKDVEGILAELGFEYVMLPWDKNRRVALTR